MIQPLDIKTQTFKKGLFGYKAADVDTYKDTVYRAYDELFADHAKLKDQVERLNKVIEDNRLKIFDLENKLANAENISGSDSSSDSKQSQIIIDEANRKAEEIIAKAKEESDKILKGTKGESVKAAPKTESPKKPEPAADNDKTSAASKFFKNADENQSISIDDDEIFVGEIEDNRKPNKMMIGDGEEDEEADFEFL